jgi:hypothetical protein
MTRQQKQKVDVRKGVYVPPKFVDQPLLKAQSDDLKSRPYTLEQADVDLQNFIEDGYSLKFSFDKRGGGFVVYLTQSIPDGPNYGWCMTGRGSTPLKALKQVAYKHWAIFDGAVWGTGNGYGYDVIDD